MQILPLHTSGCLGTSFAVRSDRAAKYHIATCPHCIACSKEQHSIWLSSVRGTRIVTWSGKSVWIDHVEGERPLRLGGKARCRTHARVPARTLRDCSRCSRSSTMPALRPPAATVQVDQQIYAVTKPDGTERTRDEHPSIVDVH
jgi:hypothetical protein